MCVLYACHVSAGHIIHGPTESFIHRHRFWARNSFHKIRQWAHKTQWSCRAIKRGSSAAGLIQWWESLLKIQLWYKWQGETSWNWGKDIIRALTSKTMSSLRQDTLFLEPGSESRKWLKGNENDDSLIKAGPLMAQIPQKWRCGSLCQVNNTDELTYWLRTKEMWNE